jgi:spore photoproduct lyase
LKNKFFSFKNIYIERKYKNNIYVKRILSNIMNNPEISYFDNLSDLIRKMPPVYDPQERSSNLALCGIRGEILRKCPGSHGHICCNYYVVNLYVGCPIGCTYCILQSYLNQPFTIINVDIENILDNIRKITTSNKDKIYRIGTGELGDSLVYDPITGFSADFIDFFSNMKNCIFEFKTKTDYIDNLLKYDSLKNITAGFSVNPQIIINSEENFSFTLDQRIIAMKKLSDKKYKIALHFDPIMNIKDFDFHYKTAIDSIFSVISPENIAWISLGTFRYTPDLKIMMEYNYPRSKLLYDEFLENHDGKFRYFKPIRIGLYNKIISYLKEKSDEMLLYLCMESPNIWDNTLKTSPLNENKMDLLFKNSNNIRHVPMMM